MTLVELDGFSTAWFPHGMWPNSTFSINTNTYVMDASGEKAVLVFRVPKTGNIDRLAAVIAAVGNAPDNGLRFSLQNVQATDGQPDGTVDENATVASGSVATGWLESGALSAARAVTRNDLLAAVIDFPTFVAGDSVTVQAMLFGTNIVNFPYGIANTSKQAINYPQIFLRYDDAIWMSVHPVLAPFTSVTTFSMNTGTTPDEAGVAFTPQFDCKLREAFIQTSIAAAADFDIVLYDSGNNVLSTETYDGDVTGTTSGRHTHVYFDTDVELAAGSLYRLVVKAAAAAANVTLTYGVVPSQMFDTTIGGTDYYATARTNAGSWTNYNNGTDGYRKPGILLGFSHLDDGAGGGGATMFVPVE